MLLTRALLTHRNALASISVLPPDVLARIFYLVALAEPPWSELQSLGWISVVHACRHCRQVALGDSSLWGGRGYSGYHTNTTWISETRAERATAIDLLGTSNAETLAMFPAHFAHKREYHLRGPGHAPL
jgi:hypothetical protein